MRYLPLLLGAAAIGCQPNTTRPGFRPLPDAAGTEVRLPVGEATRRLGEALRASSVPVSRVMLRDGYLETGWFQSRTGQPASGRPLGQRTVRVRAWVDPGRPGSSQLTVETSYRPIADPSLPQRELERQVPRGHPVAVKVDSVLRQLVERFGGTPPPAIQPAKTAADSARINRPQVDSAGVARPR
ncbi:MAG TPA: hypothetical protein VHH32_01680 [Gemmatimonadales bacterium]|nr:hypothetical protein [Gemmatimonadales bacterium]